MRATVSIFTQSPKMYALLYAMCEATIYSTIPILTQESMFSFKAPFGYPVFWASSLLVNFSPTSHQLFLIHFYYFYFYYYSNSLDDLMPALTGFTSVNVSISQVASN